MKAHMVLKIFGRTKSFAGDYGEAELKVEKTKCLNSLQKLAPSFIKRQSLNFTSNLRERSAGGCSSVRLPGEELSWGESISFSPFLGGFLFLGDFPSWYHNLSHSRFDMNQIPVNNDCLFLYLRNLKFQVSFRKGDTILLYAQVIYMVDKWWRREKLRLGKFRCQSCCHHKHHNCFVPLEHLVAFWPRQYHPVITLKRSRNCWHWVAF